MSYDDLSVIEPDVLMEMGGLTEAAVDGIVLQAETKAEEAEKLATEARRQRREQERIDAEVAKQTVAEGAGDDAETETEGPEPVADEAAPVEGEKEIAAEETLSGETGESGDQENSNAVDQVSAQEASAEATEQ
jgi:N utilization substance protein A